MKHKNPSHTNTIIITIATILVFTIIFIVALIRQATAPATPEKSNDPETIAQAAADAAQKEYAARNKIFTLTPYRNYNDSYFIDATWHDESTPITVTISLLSCSSNYQESSKQKALNYLKSKNININNYKVIYTNRCTE